MSRVLALSVAPGEVRGVLLEDDRPVELRLERDAAASLVGAVFFGRIARVVPSLPGAFIELGLARPAFLPGDKLPGGGALIEGAGLMVKIVKDGFADKAPEVTAAPDFPGRFAVWTPFRPGTAVSRQIAPDERSRLLALLAPLVNPGEGVVLRSHAAGVAAADIATDLDQLRRNYAALRAAADTGTGLRRLDPVQNALVRLAAGIGPDIDHIVIDDRASLPLLRRGLAHPERAEFDPAPGFAERYGVTEAFEEALATRLPLAGGGDITIEGTVGFTAIDVNLAAAAGRRGRAADAILAVNLAAATAVARQLRLRNIGGAIIVDFITMAARDHRRQVETALALVAIGDPVPTELHGWTRLGHLELTRRRGTASIADRMLLPGGARRPKTPATVALELLRALAATPYRPGRLELRMAAGVADELTGRLAAAFAASVATCGRPAKITIESDRDPESFEILTA
ncbi:MAG: ribonuclease [Aliidongia sp.]|nr:ribonuclease [Aliidongia sp.]